MGYREYEPIAHRFQTPIAITGFERLDLLEGGGVAAGVSNQTGQQAGNPGETYTATAYAVCG